MPVFNPFEAYLTLFRASFRSACLCNKEGNVTKERNDKDIKAVGFQSLIKLGFSKSANDGKTELNMNFRFHCCKGNFHFRDMKIRGDLLAQMDSGKQAHLPGKCTPG